MERYPALLFEGLGARRTQPLNVGIAAPYHWDAEFGDMGELADTVMDRMGGFALPVERSAALESWLQTQRYPQLDPQLVQRGAELLGTFSYDITVDSFPVSSRRVSGLNN